MDRWLVIVNPNAGSRKCERDWAKINILLNKYDVDFIPYFTDKKRDATYIVKAQIERKGYNKVLVVGGDGTVNEVVNGVFLQNAIDTKEMTIGVVLVGAGNDWSKMFAIPEDYEQAIQVVLNGKTLLQDVGHVIYHKNKLPKSRYFINAAGIGFDAVVVNKANKKKDRGVTRKSAYLMSLLSALLGYKQKHLEVRVNEKTVAEGKMLSLSFGIGKYKGGAMMMMPEAIVDDGLFDVTMIRKISKGKVVANINNIFDGSFVDKVNEVETFKGDEFSVDSDHDLLLEVDGEVLGYNPFIISMIPQGVNVIISEDL